MAAMAFDNTTICFAAFLFAMGGLLLLFIGLRLLKDITKLAITMVANSIVGLVFLFLLSLIGVKVPLTLPVIVSIALFGLGGLGTVLILMWSGMLK